MSIESRITIVVVDDHPVVRNGLVALLRTIPGLEVVGEAADGETAVRVVEEHEPDVVLMDVRMPGMDGIEATRRIREQTPGCRVLILTMHDDDATVFTAMKAGAQGYLLKEAEQDEIVRAVRGVVAGEAIFGPGVATRVLGYFTEPPTTVIDAVDEPFPELTERERDNPRPPRPGQTQRRHRGRALPLTEDREQPPHVDLREVAGRRTGRGDRAGPRGRAGYDDVSPFAVAMAAAVPVASLAAGGIGLLRTRSRLAVHSCWSPRRARSRHWSLTSPTSRRWGHTCSLRCCCRPRSPSWPIRARPSATGSTSVCG